MNIHIVHTGGTIASAPTRGVLAPAGVPAATPATDGVRFSESRPMNILSENMTPARWYELILHLRGLDLARADGLIITHGTDTLAYTACLLSLLFSAPAFPVVLVSANRPLSDPASNGRANLAAAVSLIKEKIPPGVFAVYRNSDGNTYVHAGAELLQCPCGSEDLFSLVYGGAAGKPLAELRAGKLHRLKEPPASGPDLSGFFAGFRGDFVRVLAVRPYVGIDYDGYKLDGTGAVLHGLYHSSTAAAFEENEHGAASVPRFAKRCADAGIPLYVAPFPLELLRGGGPLYETTARILDAGAIPICNATFEMALVILTLGLASPGGFTQAAH
jgi:L-asparaginase